MPKLINNQREKRSMQLSDGNIKMSAPISKSNSQMKNPKEKEWLTVPFKNLKSVHYISKTFNKKERVTIIHQ